MRKVEAKACTVLSCDGQDTSARSWPGMMQHVSQLIWCEHRTAPFSTVETCSGGLGPGSARTARRVELALEASPPCCTLEHAWVQTAHLHCQ